MEPNQTTPLPTQPTAPTPPIPVIVQSPPSFVPPVAPPAPIEVPKKLPDIFEKPLVPPEHHASWGALVGIVIILIVLIIGALYFWGAKLATEDAVKNSSESGTATTETTSP